ncbi:cold-shock protein [Bradyrhizobium sp. LMG 9283]|uniref:cold-shock protein n=1 Tax=Bradyrhizobium sp. LMG 9283 TaxID=592064 RepID=UPI00388E7DD7
MTWFATQRNISRPSSGFIQPEDGGADVFVHISAVEKAGYTNLAEGARVSYELKAGRSGKMSAENLRIG